MKIITINYQLTSINFKAGGGTGTRTLDIQLAKLALYQLSYTPLPSERRESRDKKLNRALRATSHAQVKGFELVEGDCSLLYSQNPWLPMAGSRPFAEALELRLRISP